MKIDSITVVSGTYGSLVAVSESSRTTIELTKEDCQQVQYLAERIYEQHQQRIAEEFSRPLPTLADYSEVNDD